MEENRILEIKGLIVGAYETHNPDLEEVLKHYHDKDIADAYLMLEDNLQSYVRSNLDKQHLSDVFSYIDSFDEVTEDIPNEEIADIVELMDVDDAIDALEDLDESDRSEVMSLMDNSKKEEIEFVDSFNEDQIGSKMTLDFISIKETDSIKNCMKILVEEADKKDNIVTLYVVDDLGKLVGTVDLKDLIRARAESELSEIIRLSTPYLFADELISDCQTRLVDYEEHMFPVLDRFHRLLGIITSTDIVDVVDEELGEDYAKLAGLTDEEDFNEPVLASIKRRIPWLIILLFLGFIISLLISAFEKVVIALPIIVIFQSIILDTSGNVGTQSLGVTIRMLSTEKIDRSLERKLLFKEFRVGVLNGIFLGFIALLSIFLYLMLVKLMGGTAFEAINWKENLKISLVVGISLFSSMTLSSLFGTLVPIIFKKLHIDPAVASGPFITTFSDVIAVSVYYGIAFLLFI